MLHILNYRQHLLCWSCQLEQKESIKPDEKSPETPVRLNSTVQLVISCGNKSLLTIQVEKDCINKSILFALFFAEL